MAGKLGGTRTKDYARRLRAFELFAAGVKKADIAAGLGVSRMAVTKWSREDTWDDRLQSNFQRAEEAADFSTTTTVAAAIARLRGSLGKRLEELERMCGPTTSDARVRLAAIRLWFDLVATSSRIPELLGSTTTATTPGHLEFVEDLATSNEVKPASADSPPPENP